MDEFTLPSSRRWTLATLGAAAAVLLVAIATALAMQQWRYHRDLVDHSESLIHATDATLLDLVNAETGQRGYLLTGEDRYLEPYRRSLQSVRARVARLRDDGALDSIQQRRVDRLTPLVEVKLAEMEETIDVRRHRGAPSAVELVRTDRGQRTMDSIRTVLASIAGREAVRLQARIRSEGRWRTGVLVVLVVGSLAAIALIVFLNRGLVRYALEQASAVREMSLQTQDLEVLARELEAARQRLAADPRAANDDDTNPIR